MEETLKKLLKTIKLNEGTISMVLGLGVVVIVAGMIINYFKDTPTDLPTVEDAIIAQQDNSQNSIGSIDNSLDVASGSATVTSDEIASADTAVTIAPTSTVAPTEAPAPTATTAPTSTIAPTSTTAPTQAPTDVPTVAPTATTAPQPTTVPEGQIASGVSTTAGEVAGTGAYTVQAGDDLWSIAEQEYGTGYAWVEIAQANNISNPSLIEKDQQLSLPELSKAYPSTLADTSTLATGGPVATEQPAQVQEPTTTAPAATNAISGNSYDVVKGDTLWSISVRAYNDGYQWPKLAQANGLTDNPGLIEVGMTLTIPRQ